MLFRLVIWRPSPEETRSFFKIRRWPRSTPQVGNRMELHPPGHPPLTLVVCEVSFTVSSTELVTSVLCQ